MIAKRGLVKTGMQAFSIGMPLVQGYKAGKKEGKPIRGLLKGALGGVINGYMPWYMLAQGAAGVAEQGGNFFMERMHQGPWERSNAGRANFGGNFQDTQQSATMRQRALETMQNSHINARSVLGSEARTYHRSGAYIRR